MAYSQLQKVGIVFAGIFAACLVYSIIYKRMYEPFADGSGLLPVRTCKADSDCPDKFMCKNTKCVFNRPTP